MHTGTHRLTFRDSQLGANRAHEKCGDGSMRAGKTGQSTEGSKGKTEGLGWQKALAGSRGHFK